MGSNLLACVFVLCGTLVLQAYGQSDGVFGDPNLRFKSRTKETVGNKPSPPSKGPSSVAIEPMIIGGTVAKQTQIPWQILLIADGAWLCGGSIISESWILTAAHCVDGRAKFEITAGGVDRTGTEPGEVYKTSSEAIIHEGYDDYNIYNDVAVIKLPVPYTINDYIKPIRLPRLVNASNALVNVKVQASGYGLTANSGPTSSVMNYVTLTTISNAMCFKAFRGGIISSMICTATSKQTICSGDSGGPLALKEADGVWTLVGVVSFGGLTCTTKPAGYSRVTSFLDWIGTKTSIAIRP